MSQHFSDLEGVETDIDDIVVHAEIGVKGDHQKERKEMRLQSRRSHIH